MKTWLLSLALSCFTVVCFAQVDSTTPPYKKFPTLPPIQILLGDSTTKYSKDDIPKDRPVLFMLFSPDCSHCQHEAEQMVAHKDELKDVQIVMVTMHPIYRMNEFVQQYKIDQLPHVVVGKDVFYLMPSFYSIRNLPFLALYNKKGNLVTVFEGSMDISKMIGMIREVN